MDALVVGAGPAGATAALLLARAGHEVMIVDRAAFPRAKACGDCISPGATPILRRLGVLAAIEAERPARIRGWRLVSAGGAAWEGVFSESEPAEGLALPRHRLDAVLLDAARRAAVSVATGIRVDALRRAPDGRVEGVAGVDDDGEPFACSARLVIGADGLRSVVARRLGLLKRRPRLRKISLTGHLRGVAGVTDRGELHFGPGFVAGLAPIQAGEAGDPTAAVNLTLVVDAARFAAELRADPAMFFWSRVRSVAALRDRLAGAQPLGVGATTWPIACGPFDWPTRAATADGAALVGDAAGYYDPLTGQGIYQALAGAELLAEVADRALRRDTLADDDLRAYSAGLFRMLRGPRALQHLIERVTASPGLNRIVFQCLARAPIAADSLVTVTGDLRAPSTLLSARPLLCLGRGAIHLFAERFSDHRG